MKKFLVSMMAVITAAILVACSNASNKDLVHIGVLQYVEHPSLSATRKGFIEELKEEGYVDGKNIKIDYQNAQGDQSNLQTISQSLIEDNDVMLAIATPAAQSLSSLTKGKPILFTAVTDPVSAKLVKSMDNVGGNVTGTSDMSPINKQVELLDTPGILWPKFEDQTVGLRLAFIGSIKDEILQRVEIALDLIEYLKEAYPGTLASQYGIEESNDSAAMLEEIGNVRKCIKKGTEIDYEKTAALILDDFRSSKLGLISLETPSEAEK